MVCFDKSERHSLGQTWRIRRDEFRAVIRRRKHTQNFLCVLPEISIEGAQNRLAVDKDGFFQYVNYLDWLDGSTQTLYRNDVRSIEFTKMMARKGWPIFVQVSHYRNIQPKIFFPRACIV